MTYCPGYQNPQRIQCMKVRWVFLVVLGCVVGLFLTGNQRLNKVVLTYIKVNYLNQCITSV